MKKKKFVGTMALLPILFEFATLPVYADVTDVQTINTGETETSAECQVIYKSTYDFSEEIPKYPELEVSASGYEGIYDGESHGITVDCGTDGATILYSTDGKTFTTKKPVYTNVGTYITYYKVEKDGYTTVAGSETVKIKEAMIEFDSDDCLVFYDGKNHSIDLSVATDGCTVLYSTDGINFSSKKPEYKEPGTYVIYYKIMRDNYATVVGSSTVTIKPKESTVSNNNQNNGSQNNRNQNSGNSTDGNAETGISKVQTGDEDNILFYGVMFIASVFGLATLKRREEKRKL